MILSETHPAILAEHLKANCCFLVYLLAERPKSAQKAAGWNIYSPNPEAPALLPVNCLNG